MHKKIKAKIVLALAAVMTCQTLTFSIPKEANAADMNSKIISLFKNNKNLGGFELVSKKHLKDLNCNSYEYKHKKTGARLVFLDNKEEEKMFCVSFRTPTKNSTGVNHIIEHSVLQGSKNYPVKDPFIQMSKQSLNTFLNAMTAADTTMYPVSSKNDKDFNNLMSVYLDGVFYPNAIKDERIFKEEGWRYELESKDSELKYNGVVYNEMRGRLSDPIRILFNSINKSLFPDTIYKNESGGTPEEIPNLTYKEFVDTYKKYYTPSNSYFYLSGNINIEETLKFIGEKYLNNFDKVEVDSNIPLQKEFNERKDLTFEYPIAKNEATKNKTFLSSNYVIGKAPDKEMFINFGILQSLLIGTPSSPINKAMRENGLGENIIPIFDYKKAQPTFSIVALNVNEKQKEKFQKIIDDTFRDIVKNGFNKELTNSIFNQFELISKKVTSSDVSEQNAIIMDSWLYNGDPTEYLNIDISNLRKKIENGEIQKVIQKCLLDNKHTSLVTLKPSPGLQQKKDAEQKQKLASIKKSLSQDEINKLVKDTHDLKVWQETANTKEQLAKLPTLTRNDIDKKDIEYKTVEKMENGIKILHHPVFTNEVDSMSLYFDTSKVPQDKLNYMFLLSSVLGNVDTKNYTKQKLVEKILNNSRGIQIQSDIYVDSKDSDKYYPVMSIDFESLNKNIDDNLRIINEIVFNSNFDDKNKLKEIITQIKFNLANTLMTNNQNVAYNKVISYMSESGKYKDYQGEQFYKFLCDLDKNFNSKSDEIIKNLKEVRNVVFNKQNMIASYTGEDKGYSKFADSFSKFSMGLKDEKLPNYKYKFDDCNINEGIITPSKVQYVLKGGNLKKLGYEDTGKLKVLANILESGYLWENIRVKGGAYGPDVAIFNGNMIFGSHEDPNLKETIHVIDNIPEYLRNFNASEQEMTNYIIGTIGKSDSRKSKVTPSDIGKIADIRYITGTTKEDLQKRREQIIETTAEDIRNFAKVVDAVLKQDYVCVVGGDSKIKEDEKEFVSVRNILDTDNKKDLTVSMEKKENVSVDKRFKINFSKEIDELTVNTSNIYVLDENNHKVDITVNYDKKNKAVEVKSKDNYEKGKKYTLFIKGIQTVKKDGKVVKLKAPIKMEFSVK